MKQRIFLITGVMASGKSTVSELLARRLERAVHLRGDIFRRMIVSGREEMSGRPSDEARRQLYLRYRLAADAAKTYFEGGFTVVLQDNYYGEALGFMAELLRRYPLRIAVLAPSSEAVAQRERERGKTGYAGFDAAQLYRDFMRETPRLGFWIDSTFLTPEQTATAILEHFPE